MESRHLTSNNLLELWPFSLEYNTVLCCVKSLMKLLDLQISREIGDPWEHLWHVRYSQLQYCLGIHIQFSQRIGWCSISQCIMMYLTLYSFVVSYFCLVELMIVLVRARGLWRSSTQAILYSLEPYFSASGLHFHQKSCKEQKVHSILFPKRSKNLACREATTSALFTKEM